VLAAKITKIMKDKLEFRNKNDELNKKLDECNV
jgi:hypothetical protein